MPRFLDPNAEELNSLLRPKQRVLKALKRQYRGTETTIGQESDLVDKFNRIYDSMIKLIATMGEVSNTLKLGSTAAKGAEAMSRYLSVISNVKIELGRLLLFISQQVPSLQIFSTQQIQTLSALNNQLVGVVQEIDQLSRTLPNLAKFQMIMKPIIDEVATLQQKLEGINTPSGRGSLTTFGRGGEEDVLRPRSPRSTPARTRTPATPEYQTPRARRQESTDEDENVPVRISPRRNPARQRREPERLGAGFTHTRFL